MNNKNNTFDNNKLKEFFTKPRNLFIFAIICTVLWGSAFPTIKKGYEAFDIESDTSSKILFAGIRFFFAGIMTLLIQKIVLSKFFDTQISKQFEKKAKIKLAGLIFIISFFLTFFQYMCFYIGLSNMSGAKGSIINSFSSFFTIILATICFKDDKMNRKKIIGIILGIAGILLTNLNSIETLKSSFILKGDGLMLIASISFAIGSIISKKYSSYFDPVIMTGKQLGLGGLILIICGYVTGGRLEHITTSGIILLIYLALLSCIAFSIWTILLKYNDASKVSIYNFLNPIFGVILSGIFLKESLTLNILFALLCCSIGIFIINKKQ